MSVDVEVFKHEKEKKNIKSFRHEFQKLAVRFKGLNVAEIQK